MFSTSGDILHLVLAICIAALTIFIVIAIYYVISSIQRGSPGNTPSGKWSDSSRRSSFALIRDKVKNGSAYLMVAAEVIKQAMNFVNKKEWGTKKDR
jgi:hypothetical protein